MTYFKKANGFITAEEVLDRLKPGMSIFLSSGVAEPRTLALELMQTKKYNLTDLELIQILSLGDIIVYKNLDSQKYRLKTCFSGWIGNAAIVEGRVDLIPGYFFQIPQLIESGNIAIDAAFVQISPPNASGYCSLGIAIDAARQAIQQAKLVVGEVNPNVPMTFGDTFVHISEFDCLVNSREPLLYFDRWPYDETFDRLAENVAAVVDDGCCLAFSNGPLFEALAKHLTQKKNLGIHTPFFTDALMDLCDSGAVTNRNKTVFKGKSLTSYALGSAKLMKWLDHNPMVEFESTDKVLNPLTIGQNPNFLAIVPCRKVDLMGQVAIHADRSNVATTPGEIINFVTGARLSRGGLSVFALPARNLKRESNILFSIDSYPNQFTAKEAVDMIVTEYGTAYLKGRTVRERAQAIIEIAHPSDRPDLVFQAKKHNILFKDQIFLSGSSSVYPSNIKLKQQFKNGLSVRFRAIKPSDEEQMRRLFYRFSSESVYFRYFSPLKSMPHTKMQQYVNIDYNKTFSIVGLIGEVGHGRIIAEARYSRPADKLYADVAFIVDDAYQKIGIASYLYQQLIRFGKERGLLGFTACVLSSNIAMMKVFQKFGPVKAQLEMGQYDLMLPFDTLYI